MRRICVYCGSSPGERGAYAEAARELAAELAARDLELVYGGSNKGIMGVLADAVLNAGGKVTGIMPRALADKDVAHTGLTQLLVTATMHERKAMMAEIADGFVALPGGFGTLEEIIEILTWGQLGFHQKPCELFNRSGYFDKLREFFRHAEGEGFIKRDHVDMLIVADTAVSLLNQFASFEAPQLARWRD